MKTFNYPAKTAKRLANNLKAFRALMEETAHSELNPDAENDRREIVMQIDWMKFNDIVCQLEFIYDHREAKKMKPAKAVNITLNGWTISDDLDWMVIDGDYRFFATKQETSLGFMTLNEAKQHALNN